jgi:hypothetical protein
MRSAMTILLGVAIWCGCASDSGWKHQTFAFSTPADPPSAGARTNVFALRRISVSPLYRSQSFTYRTADDTYEQDPYAAFMVPPERALAGPIRAWMGEGGAFGRVVEPGSGLTPTVVAEVSVNELCGDFRKPSQPVGAMELHFVVYDFNEESPGRIVLDKVCARETPLSQRTPAALMAAWENDLREIMQEINSDYAKASSNDGGR